jgi:hypothetical protein
MIRSEFQHNSVTLEQAVSLYKVWMRYVGDKGILPFDAWMENNVTIPGYDDCVMVKYAGMVLGIEKDGYTHS